jgi:hypothetical protein
VNEREATLRSAIVRATEALDDGNPVEARAILRSVLRDRAGRRRYPCPGCGLAFEWPGLLDEHLARSRCGLEAA